MANYCTTEYKLTGDYNKRQKLYEELESLKEREHVSFYDICEHFNINSVDRRGEITYMTNEDNWLFIETESAWNANNTIFEGINERYDEAFTINYRETEPGCEIFNLHDEDGVFPREEKVLVEGYYNDHEFEENFSSMSEAFEYIVNDLMLDIDLRDFDDDDEAAADEIADRVREENEDWYVYFREYKEI